MPAYKINLCTTVAFWFGPIPTRWLQRRMKKRFLPFFLVTPGHLQRKFHGAKPLQIPDKQVSFASTGYVFLTQVVIRREPRAPSFCPLVRELSVLVRPFLPRTIFTWFLKEALPALSWVASSMFSFLKIHANGQTDSHKTSRTYPPGV